MPLVVNTVSDSRDAQKDLAKLKDSITNIESSIKDTTNAFAKFSAGIAASVALVSSLKELTAMSDRFTNLENKIKSVTDSTTQFKQALQGVKDIAINTRSDLNATASLYQKIAINQKEVGINTKDTLRVVEIVGKALKLSGANGQEATAAMLQFGQAIGSGKLQGDELRSLSENAPALVKIIADSLHISVGALKKAGADGKLTVDKILPGLVKNGDIIDKKFATLGVTFGDAFNNLKLGFDLMANAFSKFLFGSGNGFATFINDIGKGLANIAKHFGVYMALARSYVMNFIIKTMILFEDLWPTIKEFAANVAGAFNDLVTEWTPSFKAAADFVKQWFAQAAGMVVIFSKGFIDALYETDFGKMTVDSLIRAKDFISSFISSIFSKFNITLPEINLENFLSKLEPLKSLVLNFVNTVERAFFWLYDRVIGHSWIPDLVNGVIAWMSKLLDSPLKSVKDFVSSSNAVFASLSAGAIFLGLGKKTKNLKVKIAGIVSVVTGLALALTLANTKFKEFLESKKEAFKPIRVEEAPKLLNTGGGLGDSFKTAAEKFSKAIKDFIGESPISRTMKQLLGLKDKYRGQIFGTQIDTNARVGRGPRRYSEDRPFLHDIVNTLPEKLQVPVYAAVSGAISLALASGFSNPIVRNAALTLFTGVAAIQASKIIDPKVVRESLFNFANSLLTFLSWGLEKALGGNAIKDPLGLLALFAKFALLFKAGREMLLGAAKSVITAPTAGGRTVGMLAERSFANFRANQYQKQIADLPNKLTNAVFAARSDYQTKLSDLMVAARNAGTNLNMRQAVNIARTGQTQIPGLQGLATAANLARDSFVNARTEFNNLNQTTQQLTARQQYFANASQNISDTLAAQRMAMVQGIKTFTSGAAGIVGGVAGAQLGVAISNAMSENTPAWQKTATILAAGFIGQFLASAVVSVITSTILTAFSLAASGVALAISAAFASGPVIASIAVLTIALAAGYLLFKSLPKDWKNSMKDWIAGIPDRIWSGIKENIKNTNWANISQQTSNPMLTPMSAGLSAGASQGNKIVGFFEKLSDRLYKLTSQVLPTQGQSSTPPEYSVVNATQGARDIAANIPNTIKNFASSIFDAFIKGRNKPDTTIFEDKGYAEAVNTFNSTSEKFKEFLSKFTNPAKETSTQSADSQNSGSIFNLSLVKFAGDSINQNIIEPLKGKIEYYLRSAYDYVLETFVSVKGKVISSVDELISPITTSISDFFDTIKNSLDLIKSEASSSTESGYSAILESVKSYVDSFATSTSNWVSNFISQINFALDLIWKNFNVWFDSLKTDIFGVLRPIGTKLETIFNLISSYLTGIVDKVTNWTSKNIIEPYQAAKAGVSDFVANVKFDAVKAQTYEPIKRANGGYISGSGGPTDDKIPALLSNGEFVINAEATKNNYSLLEAINSGKPLRFWGGGAVDPIKQSSLKAHSTISETAKQTSSALDKFTEVFKKFFKEFRESLADSPELQKFLDKFESTVKTAFGGVEPAKPITDQFKPPPPDETTFKKYLENLDPKKFGSEITNTLKKAGFSGISSEDLAALQKSPTDEATLIDLVSKIKYYSDIAETRKGKASGRYAAEMARSLKGTLDDYLVSTVFGNEPPSRYKPPSDAEDDKTKKQAFKLKQQYTTITDIFPELGLSLEEFYRSTDDFRESLFSAARKLYQQRFDITDQVLGSINIEKGTNRKDLKGVLPKDIKPGKAKEAYTQFEENRNKTLETFQEDILAFRSSYTNIRKAFSDAGISEVSDRAAAMFSKEDFKKFYPDLRKLSEARKIKETSKDDIQVNAAQKTIDEILPKVKDSLTLFEISIMKPFEKISTQGQALGLTIDQSVYNLLGSARDSFNETIIALYNKLGDIKVEKDPVKIRELTLSLNNDIAEVTKFLEKLKKIPFAQKLEQAGESFANSISENFSGALAGYLKGEAEADKSMFQTFVSKIAKGFSSSVIDTFSKSVTDSLFNSDSFLGKGLNSLGSSIFKTGFSIFGKNDGSTADKALYVQLTNAFSGMLPGQNANVSGVPKPGQSSSLSATPGSTAETPSSETANVPQQVEIKQDSKESEQQTNTLSDVSKGIGALAGIAAGAAMMQGNGFQKLIGLLSITNSVLTIIQMLQTAKLFSASGGYVSGPGTSTSDSISAMLSNGEYVVNAKSTKATLPLLEAINNGKIPKFADGGLVSTAIVSTPTIASIEKPNSISGNSQQVINISITGDISRQTRSEIYKMLPSIAEGVNSHNREKGYK